MVELLKDLSVDFKDPYMPLRQVLVNTHSPVVIGNIEKWSENPNVSIWYARIVNKITKIQHLSNNLSITKISPVSKQHNNYQLSLVFSEAERKLTLSTIKNYLKTADFQNH